MTVKQEKKEHIEHQKALKPLLTHLKEDEKKLGEKKMKHKLTHSDEVKGGHHSHKAKADHHHKHASHHHKEMHKHLKELHKMAKGHHKK